jgi:hypothetical protein
MKPLKSVGIPSAAFFMNNTPILKAHFVEASIFLSHECIFYRVVKMRKGQFKMSQDQRAYQPYSQPYGSHHYPMQHHHQTYPVHHNMYHHGYQDGYHHGYHHGYYHAHGQHYGHVPGHRESANAYIPTEINEHYL